MAHICFVCYDLSVCGGAERVVSVLANRLSAYHAVSVLSLHGDRLNPALSFRETVSVRWLGLKEGRIRSQLLAAFFPLRAYFRKNKINVAFLETTYVGFIGAPLGRLSSAKVVFCDHGALMSQIDDHDITNMRRIAAFLCNKTVVLTERSKKDYLLRFHIKEKKLSCIYNWIDPGILAAAGKNNYDPQSRIILSVGRMTAEKGYDLLVKVARLVLPLHSDWAWHIYGDGPLREKLAKEIRENNLERQLILQGETNQIQQVYGQAALLVLPSYREGLPLVLLEAKAHRLPCVSFDITTGPGEIIQQEENGFLIPPYDVRQMADAVNRLIGDSALRAEMSANAYKNMEKFSESVILQQWLDLIENH